MHVVPEGAHKMFWVKHEADVILHDDLLMRHHKFYLSAWRDAGTDEEQSLKSCADALTRGRLICCGGCQNSRDRTRLMFAAIQLDCTAQYPQQLRLIDFSKG
jgi:hypothetical protein